MEYLLVSVSSMRMRREVHCGTLKPEFCGKEFGRAASVDGIKIASSNNRSAAERKRESAGRILTHFLLNDRIVASRRWRRERRADYTIRMEVSGKLRLYRQRLKNLAFAR